MGRLKCIILSVLSLLGGNLAMPQSISHANGGRYLKTIEYNVLHPGKTEDENRYNLGHKSVIDRLFFGTQNAFVEFVFMDSPEGSNQAVAFRIIENKQNDSYELEMMRLQNVLEVYCKKLMFVVPEKTTPIMTPFWLSAAISNETKDRIKEHNKQADHLKNSDDLYKPYRPAPLKLVISREFAEQLHEKTSMLIGNFKGAGIPLNIADGSEVTFRCVVGDELWTLSVHCPQGGALRLSDFFGKMITDGFNNRFNEPEYLNLLKEIN